MFLLIPDGNDSEFTLSVFTFHDVSINTTHHLILPLADRYFTFHDVSINTETDPDGFMSIPDFTFHDVSINTCESRRAL